MWQRVTIPRLLGLNLDENPDALAPGELVAADNACRRGNFVGTRPGVVALGTGEDYENAVDETNAIRGAIEFRQSYDENRALIVVAEHTTGSQIFYQDGAQLAGTPTIAPSNDYIYSMTVHANRFYMAGGPPGKAQVQTEEMVTWDGDSTVPSAATDLVITDKASASQLYPKFVLSWSNFLLINGLQQTAANRNNSNNPAVTRYATFGSDPTADASWSDANTLGFNATRIGIGTYGENFATGFGTYTDNRGNFLMVLGSNQIASYRGDIQFGNDFVHTDTIDLGCVHERAFVNPGLDVGDAVFVSDKPAVHSLRQSQEHGDTEGSFLSWKIRTFMNGLNRSRIHHTCAAYAANLGMIVFAFSTATHTSEGHDVLMALDVRDKSTLNARDALWYGPWRLSGDITVNHMAYLRSAANAYSLHLFTTAGRVLRFDESVHSDLTSSGYGVLIETKPESYGDILSEKRVGDTQVVIASDVGGAYDITVRTIFDFGRKQSGPVMARSPLASGSVIGATTLVGTATVGGGFGVATRKLYTAGKGQTVGYRFQHGGTNQPFYIGRIDTQVSGMGESSGSEEAA